MSETETESAEPKPRRKRRTYVRVAVAVAVVAVAAGAALTYDARRTLARDALVGWLRERGIESEVELSTFDLGAVDGRLRIGPRSDPDVIAELAEVRYGLTGFWNREPLGVQVVSVRLVRPVVKASFKGGKLSLGSLDPLIEEFSRRPPQPDRGQPSIRIEGSRLALDTDYGRMSARADARLEDGRLMLLNARVTPVQLRGRALAASLGEAEIRAATTGKRIDILVQAPILSLTAGDLMLKDARLRFDAKGPYPDLKRQRGDGELFARLALEAASLARGDSGMRGVRLAAQFDGTSAGWLETLALAGDATATLTADAAYGGGVEARAVKVRANATDLKWGRKGGDVLAAQLWTEAVAGSADAGEARLSNARIVASGPVGLVRGNASFALDGRATGGGGWSGLGAPSRADPAETAALKRALQDVRFDAPAFRVTLADGAVTVGLPAPLQLRTVGGGEATLSAIAGRPLFADGAGAFRLATRGGGLPSLELAVDRYRTTADAVIASARLTADGSFGPLVGAKLDTRGEARLAGGALAYSAHGCAPFSLERLEMGENDALAVKGELCPGAAPTLTLADGAWRVRGEARGVAAAVPFLEARADGGGAAVDIGGRGEDLRVETHVRTVRLTDTATDQRFNPVQASGQARLAGGVWSAGFEVTDPAGRKLGDAKLAQDATGRGRLDFDTGVLAFEDGGLQPADLSPLAEMVASPAHGQARFVGEMAWTPEAAISRGVLDVTRLDFRSPAGPVVGVSGQVAFTSLAPLEAAPGQVLRAERIETAAPLTDAEITFGIGGETLKVSGATFAVEGGELTLEPFEIPFAPNPSWSGVLVVDGVQVKQLVEASPFGDRMDMEAKLSGRMPFQVTPEGVRVAAGRLYAVEPGRLSIRREALTGVEAEGALAAPGVEGAAAAPPNTFTEFAYQAMEHLAFNQLEADINSQDGGRLGVLFRIKGRHSPPQRQEIRLSILEVLRQTYLQKSLPLPSGTEVDLTLDTSVNLDELLKDFADYQALRGSQAVQPSP